MKYVIKDQECGYLVRNGRFEKLLTAGKYNFPKVMGYEVQTVPMTGEVKTCGIPVEVLMEQEEFRSRVAGVQVPDECVAFHFVNKAFKQVISKQEAYYWNVFESNEFRLVDMTEPEMEISLPRIYLDLMLVKYYKKIAVKDGEAGLLYYDNRFEKRLEQGTYYFWNYGKEVTCKIFNLKIQQLEVNGQEILTADKVSVRLNMTVQYRIADPKRLVQMVEGVGTLLYTCAQLTARDYIGRFRMH